jgi:hypothetical protein
MHAKLGFKAIWPAFLEKWNGQPADNSKLLLKKSVKAEFAVGSACFDGGTVGKHIKGTCGVERC